MKLTQNDNHNVINNKEMVDSTSGKDETINEEQKKNLKIFDSNIFKFKVQVDLKNTPLSWRTKIGFSLGHFFNDAAISVWFCYSLLYFKLYFTNTMAGSLMLVGQVSDAIITQIIGFYSDRQKCTPDSWFLLRAGKRKFYHIIGTLLLMILFPLSYVYPLLLENDGEALRKFSVHTIIYVVIIALFQAAWAKVQVSHVSLITDLTSLKNERIALNAYRQAATVLANLFIYVLMLLLLSNSNANESTFSRKDAKIVAMVSGIACLVGAVTSVLFYLLVKEPGQCLLNKNKRKLEQQQSNDAKIVVSVEKVKQTSQFHIEKNLKSVRRLFTLPEKLNDRVVGSTENSDYVPGVWKQTSFNDITPYFYPNFYHYSTALKITKQDDNQQPPLTPVPFSQSNFVSSPVNESNQRPKSMESMESISIDTTESDKNSNLYQKKIDEPERKKSKLSLKNVTKPVKSIQRMFSFEARREFECKDWLKCAKFWKVAFIFIMSRLYYNTTQVYTTLYLTYTLKLNKTSIAIVPFVVYISGFIVSLTTKPLSAKIGTRYVLLIGCIFSIVSSIWFNFGDESNLSFKTWQVYGATIFNGIGCTAILISSMSITTDLIGDNKNSGFVFASMSFLDKLINGLTVYFIELFNPEVPSYYQYVLVYAAGASVVFALFGLFSIRKSSLGKLDDKNDNMLKNLAQQSIPAIQ